MIIKIDDLKSTKIIELLQEHHQDMLLQSPPQSVHALDVRSLQAVDVTFWSAWIKDNLAGCGALKRLSSDHAEIKSMRTSKTFLRQGVAAKLLRYILNEAGIQGYMKISLETGSKDAFIPARTMYEKFGFKYCNPFADYTKDVYSVFMTKEM